MSLDAILVYMLIVTTSAGAYIAGHRIGGCARAALSTALKDFVECVGTFALFLAANMVLGILVILIIRGAVQFLSLYVLNNTMLVLLSAFQGIVFHLWWRRSNARV